jgi:tetratricopeptide (TPR) repeat protein
LDKSIEHLKKACELRIDRASAYNNLGLSYFENGDYKDSLSHYNKAISLEPSSVHYNNLGLANYQLNQLEDAL